MVNHLAIPAFILEIFIVIMECDIFVKFENLLMVVTNCFYCVTLAPLLILTIISAFEITFFFFSSHLFFNVF